MKRSNFSPASFIGPRRHRAKYFSAFRAVIVVACFTFAFALYGRPYSDAGGDESAFVGLAQRRHLLQGPIYKTFLP